LQNDADAGDVDAQVAGEVQNKLQALNVLLRIEAGITFGTGRL